MFEMLRAVVKFGVTLVKETNRAKRWRKLSPQQVAALDDEELLECMHQRILAVEDWDDVQQRPRAFQTAYVLLTYDMEVQNGGLCQYFVNSSRETAPALEGALSEVGAEAYREQFHQFVTENGLDVHDLSRFIIEEVEAYEALAKSLPFDAFDEAYYALYEKQPLQDLYFAYIKANLPEFFK